MMFLPGQFRGVQSLWIIGVVLALLTVIGAGAAVWDLYRRTIEEATDNMRDLGVVVAEQTKRYVQVVDLLQQEIQSRILEEGINTPEDYRRRLSGEDTHRFLVERTKGLSQPPANALFDADGELMNSSYNNPVPKISIANREYFRHLRDHADNSLFISVPDKRRSTGSMAVFLAHRLNGPDGTFLGVVVAPVDIAYLADFYKAISHERGVDVTLLRRDGVVLARYPTIAPVGQSIPSASPWFAQVAAGGGTFRSPGYLAAARSIVSVNPLHDYPLVIDVSIHERDVLAAWWRQTAYTLGAEVVLAGAFGALFWMIGRQMRRQEKHNVALWESESRLRDFAELASDWFWEQDADLRFTKFDPETPQHAGDDKSYLGKQRWEINDASEHPERWESHRCDVLAHRPFRDFRFERLDVDGRLRHVSVGGMPVHDASGAFVGYRGIGRDITTEVEAERVLRKVQDRAEQAETLLRDAVDSISEGLVIYDREDRFVMCNEPYRKLYAERVAHMVPGAHFVEILLHATADRSVAGEAEWLAELLRHHREATGAIEHRHADGTWILITDRRMKSGGIVGLRINITALKQTEEALRDSEAHLARAQEIAEIGSWELDIASGRYIWSRHLYRIRGFPPDFLPTRENLASTVLADDAPLATQWVTDLEAGGERRPIEIRVTRPDGEARVLRIEGRPVVDADGVIRRLAGTAQDITERRLIDRQLAQSLKIEAIGNLTGGLAHDFNNVLGVIIGNLDLLKRVVKGNAAALELCGEALDGANRCADLIRRLLAFARSQPLHPEQTDANALVSDIARLLGRILGEDIVLKLDLDATLWPVIVDPAQLEAALVNLAANARDAMPGGGKLDVVTRNATLDAHYVTLYPDVAPGEYALIEISDTGTGIPPEIISRIFEPFFTTKGPGKGSGLGLSMAFGFVTQSGGQLAVYSEPGLGTTFRLYLPRSVAGVAGSVARSTMDVMVVGGDETVLIVEDNAQLRRTAARQLIELGYQVREAEQADAALTILLGGDPVHLLFSDVVMPGIMDGLELAHRATQLRPGLCVLLTSGFPGVRGADHAIALNQFPLLTKPYHYNELARALREALSRADEKSTILERASPTSEVDMVVTTEQV